MIFSSNNAALFGIFNWANQSVSKALDYQEVFGIKTSAPKDKIIDLIKEAGITVRMIKALCNPKELAMLEFFYGYEDERGKHLCRHNFAKQFYENDIEVGILVGLYWRNKVEIEKSSDKTQKVRIYQELAEQLNASESTARRLADHEYGVLEQFRLNFYHSDMLLAQSIEQVLIDRKLKSEAMRGC